MYAADGIAVYAFIARGAALGAGLAERFAVRGRKAVLHLSAGAPGAASTSGLTSTDSVTGSDSVDGMVDAPSAEAVLSILIVGNSQSRVIFAASSAPRLLTPRGYARKYEL